MAAGIEAPTRCGGVARGIDIGGVGGAVSGRLIRSPNPIWMEERGRDVSGGVWRCG